MLKPELEPIPYDVHASVLLDTASSLVADSRPVSCSGLINYRTAVSNGVQDIEGVCIKTSFLFYRKYRGNALR
jgi:hypothetical protein